MTSTTSPFIFQNRPGVTDGIQLNLSHHMGSNHINSHILGIGNPQAGLSNDQNSSLAAMRMREPILKTPVSLLNEVCAKAKVLPVFETTEDGPVHDRIYECCVKVEKLGGSWEGKGHAKTKKDAKQEAAKDLLLSMDEKVDKLLIPVKEPMDQESVPAIEFDPEVPGNPVGELNDLCLKIKRLPPDYEEVGEEGKPHERVYTLACKLGQQIIEKGRGRSKKHAKKVAAHKVKQRLLELMSQVEGVNLIKQDDDNIVEKIQTLTLFNKKSVKEANEAWRLTDWLAEFKQRSGVKLLSLLDKSVVVNLDNAKLLRDVAEEQKFKVEYLDIEDADEDDQFSCVVSIGIEPVAIFLGRGGSKTQARKSAAVKAIEFLRIAIKN